MKLTKKTIKLLSLGVLALVIILGTLLFSTKSTGKSRGNATTRALAAAITRYHKEYNQWPLELALANGLSVSNDTPDGAIFVIPGPQNFMVFDMLRANTNNPPTAPNPGNVNNIRFLDDRDFLTLCDDKCTPRHLLPTEMENDGLIEGGHPLVYQGADGTIHYFTIVFEMDKNSVTVEL